MNKEKNGTKRSRLSLYSRRKHEDLFHYLPCSLDQFFLTVSVSLKLNVLYVYLNLSFSLSSWTLSMDFLAPVVLRPKD